MRDQSPGGLPSTTVTCSRITDQRRDPLRAARDCRRRSAAAALIKPLAGPLVPKCRFRRAGNPGPDSRRALPDTPVLIRSAIILRKGPGLVITQTNNKQFAITLDCPEEPASILLNLISPVKTASA
jgi:hypothetical protein